MTALDARPPERDPAAVLAARKRARRMAWVLALAALTLYGWVILSGSLR